MSSLGRAANADFPPIARAPLPVYSSITNKSYGAVEPEEESEPEYYADDSHHDIEPSQLSFESEEGVYDQTIDETLIEPTVVSPISFSTGFFFSAIFAVLFAATSSGLPMMR